MSVLSRARVALRNFSNKLLDIDDSEVPEKQMDVMRDYMSKFVFDTNVDELDELVKILKKKYMADSICVSTKNGSLIVSTNGLDTNQAVTCAALFNYINSEIPKSETVFIKSDGWQMFFPYNDKIYIIKAGAELSYTELQALAKDIESFFKKH